jgi:preprotein translocase subunit SecG
MCAAKLIIHGSPLSMLFTFLLVVHGIIAATMVGFILVQRSEGGGLTSGGSPSGLMSARGSADFLTRGTAILATFFVVISITLAVMAAHRQSTTIDTTLAHSPAQTAPAAAPTAAPAAPEPNSAAPAGNSAVPLAQ